MTLHDVALDDKFDLGKERIFLSGAQAVIRMLLMQRERDRRNGLNTAGFVSGYRGSPLGGFDLQLWKARKQLAEAGIVFQPGLNEELAATACWGSQQAELLGEGKHDGVFSVWYGKGPGVDRSGDVFRHANLAGSSKHGGVLALMGDDHLAESSTIAHATEFLFVDTMIPILNPAGVQELIDYGLYGYGLSRFAGTWTAIKCVKDNIESTASVDVSLDRLKIVIPQFDMPPGGLNIRHEIDMLGQEERLHEYKRAAAEAFIRANDINRIVYSGGPDPKIGIITVGKSYLDVRQGLDDLAIDEDRAARLGVRLSKIGCPWPLDVEHLKAFARGLEMIIVVEEKRSLIEVQVREYLYGTSMQPLVVGKKDERGDWLFPAKGALDPNDIAIAVGERILRVVGPVDDIAARVARIRQYQAMLADAKDISTRTPFFCSGCPHNSSTKVPQGSIAGAGIGCHFMALWMDRDTVGFTAMGGEGAQWVGQAPFSTREHFFQNVGDGTYNHSGVLALRFARGSGVNMTYKILFNDAVAMTGGQPHEGNLTVEMIAAQVRAEGVERIAVVSDEPAKYKGVVTFPAGTTVHHRDDMDQVQRELREVKGVSVLIYDQTCAAEKRRRRKRGTYPDPDKRVIINELVCEGCGDCGVQSNCVSVQPVETEFGRKRRIDQSTCNKDFSCVNGFCPSFVTVHGAKIRKAEGIAGASDPLHGIAEPTPFPIEGGWSAIIDGVGGTGVVTIGAVLGMAAHLEGKGCGMIDMAGLAQKGGAVFSHVRIARTPEEIHAIRVSAGKADLVLGCDLVVSGGQEGARLGQAEPYHLRRQHGRDHARRVYPVGRFFAAGAPSEKSNSRGGRRRERAFLRRHPDGGRAVRQFARRQHVHARLRLPARRAAAVLGGSREGDRAQRRGRGDERCRVPLGPAGCTRARIRARAGGRTGRAGGAADRAVARGDRGASRGVSQRLPEPPLCQPIPAPRRRHAAGRGEGRAGLDPGQRSGGAQPLQADGREGRIRGCAALYGWLVPAPARRPVPVL
jgi:indolepyruvate ferredoxin oxidoreductase